MRSARLLWPLLLVFALSGCPKRQAAVTPKATPAATARVAVSVPTYACQEIATPLKIDGVLDEPAWAKAPVTGPLTLWDGKPAAHATKTRLLWSKKYLYVGFSCEDPDIEGTMRRRDQNLWEENEVVEVFVDSAGDGLAYLEFEVNPLNTALDLIIPKAGAPGSLVGRKCWDARGMRTATHVQGTIGNSKDKDKGWSCEMAIPLEDFLTAPNCPPKNGDVWRVNLYRVDVSLGQVEFQAWSPTYTPKPAFHVPDHFGKLQFVALPAPTPQPTTASAPAPASKTGAAAAPAKAGAAAPATSPPVTASPTSPAAPAGAQPHMPTKSP